MSGVLYPRAMAAILCFDFDDTILLDNSTRLVFERFAAGEWRALEADYHAGKLTVEQFNIAAFDLIEATPEDLAAAIVEDVHVRNGFLELLDWATWNDWQPVVVSNGFDFALNAVLDSLGLYRIARHAGRTRFAYRWRVRYDSPRGVEIEDGFKLSFASAFKNAGDCVVYFGDGASDIPAARLAQAVFARDTLLERLAGHNRPVFPFETFHDAVAVLDKEARGWLESFSSTTAAGA